MAHDRQNPIRASGRTAGFISLAFYRSRLTADAERRCPMSLEFRPVKEGHTVAEWVKALKGKSGVYVIREPGFFGEVLYCGESHTGRLNTTLLRHFQHWTGKTAGATFAAS